MYAALVAIAVLGAVLTWGLERLRRRLLPWAQDVADVVA
jgi:ABC-type nitrate/sulfonate/bicarbonate transport system permease component